jgi:hypothetical protein
MVYVKKKAGKPLKKGKGLPTSNIDLKTGKRKYMRKNQDASENEDAEEFTIDSHPEAFEIESGVPIQVYRLAKKEVVDLHRKLAATVQHIKVDQSFVIPKKSMTAAKKFFADTYKSMLFKMSVIVPEKKNVRVWRVK